MCERVKEIDKDPVEPNRGGPDDDTEMVDVARESGVWDFG
jgi:hypothetical protein